MSRRTHRSNIINEEHITLLEDRQEVTMQEETGDYQKDFKNILLLLFLYILQGIPLGLAASIPMILQQHEISYKDQATFSLAFWPFSIKILWAPIVDSCYSTYMGRRKSWLIPSQYLIGFFMLFLSTNVETWLDESKIDSSYITLLTVVFFFLNFLAATQDIAVDGWGLTMLHKENVGWTSTCNSVGQSVGYFLGYVVFLALESKSFCKNYLWQGDSLVTLPGFLYFWGIIFLITTTLVWIFKTEDKETYDSPEEIHLGLYDTYKVLGVLLRMSAIKKMLVVLLTAKIGFAVADNLTVLKLTEASVPRDHLAMISIPLTPLQIILPFYISKFTAGPRPMDLFLKAYIPRLSFGIVFAALVYFTPSFKLSDGSFPTYYYMLAILICLLHQVAVHCMFVAQMSFFARVSDTKIGGTYMTLLNTFTNLGGNWPNWVALRIVSEMTWTSCHNSPSIVTCDSAVTKTACVKSGGSCTTDFDGYYIESFTFIIIGLFWFYFGAKVITKLQNLSASAWKIDINDHRSVS